MATLKTAMALIAAVHELEAGVLRYDRTFMRPLLPTSSQLRFE
jgi:hypothetical protein